MKRFFVLFLVFFAHTIIHAQNFENSWVGYFSYVSIQDIKKGNDKLYVAAENAVFSYDLSTQEINTLSTINGLAGETITSIHYSINNNLLVIGYENGLIEIVRDGEENVLHIVDILEKPTIPPNKKRINHFNEYDNLLYIATEFGVSVYNLELLEFGDTYFIGNNGAQINISQTVVEEPYIYAASTEQGIKRADINNPNLVDFANWTTIANGGYKGIQKVGDNLYAAGNNNIVYEVSNTLTQVGNINQNILDFQAAENLLTITTQNTINTYNENFQLVASVSNAVSEFSLQLQSGLAFNNNQYLGTADNGLLIVPFNSNQAQQILPDGPINNHPFTLDATPGQLWVAYGDISVSFNPFPLTKIGISNLKDDVWTNIPYQELFDANDLVRIRINPQNPDEVYMTSFQKGLLKIENQTPSILFNETNSPLEIPANNTGLGIRLFGLDFDRAGNLWTNQSRINEGLIKVTPSGQFQRIDISSIIDAENNLALTDLATSKEGYVFFGATNDGLVGYDPNGNRFNLANDQAGNLPSTNIKALAFDKNNSLFIGTLRGLRVLYNASGFFEDDITNVQTRPIIINDSEVNAGQELLFEQSITDIVIDGSNNKWIATASSGVFHFSSTGQETLHHFTKDNSPLPSNNVQAVAIDDLSGVVYFATINGLVAYKGTATAPRDDLSNVYAFPNPVRPGFTGNVTIDGLTENANVKITDISGNLVFETTSEGGSVLWDTTAFGRHKVASGVYLVMVSTEDLLETKITKIMIVR